MSHKNICTIKAVVDPFSGAAAMFPIPKHPYAILGYQFFNPEMVEFEYYPVTPTLGRRANAVNPIKLDIEKLAASQMVFNGADVPASNLFQVSDEIVVPAGEDGEHTLIICEFIEN